MKLTIGIGVLLMLACGGGKAPDDGAPSPPDASSAGTVHIATSAATYTSGADVALTIHNATQHQVAFNPCTREVEQESNQAWTVVPEPGRVCTMEAWLLDPDSSRSATTQLPADLSPGRYRLAIAFGAQDQSGVSIRGVSNAFEVQ